MHITFIATFVPRKCGIATYTKDLTDALQKRGIGISVYAMENPQLPTTYNTPVVNKIPQQQKEMYLKTASLINKSSTDLVHIQHEFGIFGGDDGAYILELAKALTKPYVVTFHTVLITPSDHQKYIMQELARLSRRITVMDEIARERLSSVYNLNPKDIRMIVHGAPDVRKTIAVAKKQLNLRTNFIVLVNNLLSRNKGIEYAIEAISLTLGEIPNIKLLIVGETHPLVKLHEGESYRDELTALVLKRGVTEHVVFRNEYVPLEELTTLLAAADVYITPYLDPEQITSGTLTYALNAGKVCIATEYIYAKQMLARGRGILVPFRDSKAIADALVDISTHPTRRRQIEARVETLSLDWRHVATLHSSLYAEILGNERKRTSHMQKVLRDAPDVRYLFTLTDDIGIFQHAQKHIADTTHGYSTDDTGRALIVTSQLDQALPEVKKLFRTYVQFLTLAQEHDGAMHTFLSADNVWLDAPDIADAYGRALWGLGFSLSKKGTMEKSREVLFLKGVEKVREIRDTRTACYSLLGLYYYLQTQKDIFVLAHVVFLADVLVTRYEAHQKDAWQWFENEMTYDNFRFPQALFAAYLLTGNETYKETALHTLEFVEKHNFNSVERYFDFVGQDGWLQIGQEKQLYDQQPLEAEGAVSAYLFAYKTTLNAQYLDRAIMAFSWFHGENRNHRTLIDEATGGVYDGLTRRGVNLNEGAESIVSYLIALLALKDVLKKR